MSKIGYIRVSTEHQETARQQEIMCGYQVDRIFSEKISGANKVRPQLRAMLDYVREGDTLYVESISRLGRSRQRSYPYQPQRENRHQHACVAENLTAEKKKPSETLTERFRELEFI